METIFRPYHNYLFENARVALISMTEDNVQPLYRQVNEKGIWKYYPMLIDDKKNHLAIPVQCNNGQAVGSAYPLSFWTRPSTKLPEHKILGHRTFATN